jgi:hypothetical protein
MATAASTNAQIYLGVTNASPIDETFDISIDYKTDSAQDTAHGDTNRTYIPTLSDVELSIDKHVDFATGGGQLQAWVIARTTLKMYLYPDRLQPTVYWYGTVKLYGGGMKLGLEDVIDSTFQAKPASAIGYQHP